MHVGEWRIDEITTHKVFIDNHPMAKWILNIYFHIVSLSQCKFYLMKDSIIWYPETLSFLWFWFIHEAQAKDLKKCMKLWSVCFFCPQSIPKNMKPELEISPDNEVLDSLSMESPPACQGETEELLTNLDKVWSGGGTFKLLLSLSSSTNMN